MESEEAFNTIDRLFQEWFCSWQLVLHHEGPNKGHVELSNNRSEHCLWQKAHRVCRFWEVLQGEGWDILWQMFSIHFLIQRLKHWENIRIQTVTSKASNEPDSEHGCFVFLFLRRWSFLFFHNLSHHFLIIFLAASSPVSSTASRCSAPRTVLRPRFLSLDQAVKNPLSWRY